MFPDYRASQLTGSRSARPSRDRDNYGVNRDHRPSRKFERIHHCPNPRCCNNETSPVAATAVHGGTFRHLPSLHSHVRNSLEEVRNAAKYQHERLPTGTGDRPSPQPQHPVRPTNSRHGAEPLRIAWRITQLPSITVPCPHDADKTIPCGHHQIPRIPFHNKHLRRCPQRHVPENPSPPMRTARILAAAGLNPKRENARARITHRGFVPYGFVP